MLIIGVLFVIKFTSKSDEIKFDTLIELVDEHQVSLDWKHFNKYIFTEKQEGLLYRTYDVEGNYILEISGKNLENKPFKFSLKNINTEESINILEDDIIMFLGDDY